MLLHGDISHTKVPLRRDFPARRCFHTRKRFHTHTHIFLHRDIRDEFTLSNFCAHTDAIANRGASTKEALTRGAVTYGRFYTDILTYSCMIPDGGHQVYAKEFTKRVQNQNFTTALDDLDVLRAKWFCGRRQNVNFTAFFFQRSKSKENVISWQL